MAKSTPPLVHPQLCLLRYGNIFNTLRSPPSPPSSPNLILVLGCSSCIPVVTKVGLQSLHPTGYPGSHLGGLTHFPGGSETKKSACNEGDPDPWVRKIHRRRMATYSSILTWRIPWREDPGGLQLQRLTKGQTWLSD